MIHYREAVLADAESICQFQVLMAQETEGLTLNNSTCLNGVNAVFNRPELGKYFVASLGDEVIASCLLTREWSDWRNGQIEWLQSVFVSPKHRRAGVFRGLFEHVRETVRRSPESRGLRLYVDHSNLIAQAVYLKMGMNGDHYRVFEWMKA
jgi:GNAT superfamily N-acetyltransferase